MLRRLFAVMGMFPIGYYDLSAAGLPVHSTAFRPVRETALKDNPFRVFTSLLRLDLVTEPELRAEAEAALAARDILTPVLHALVERAERDGGLAEVDAACFVREALETFRWYDRALVPKQLYSRLNQAHRLLADVVSFKGPHINHLTPRVLDIDRIQELMPAHGIVPNESIDGPRRSTPEAAKARGLTARSVDDMAHLAQVVVAAAIGARLGLEFQHVGHVQHGGRAGCDKSAHLVQHP